MSVPAIDCGSPPALSHGYAVYSPGNTTYGHQVKYRCHRGYWFSRQVFSRLSTCDHQGHWVNVVDCVRKSCCGNFELTSRHVIIIIIMIMIRQFIRRRNMSMRSLQGRRTTGSRDECRTAPDATDPWTKPSDLSHWPACRQL